jgi:hypothetical protein
LNLQDQNFLFFTIRAYNNGDSIYYDRDSNPYDIPAGTWTHIAITFTNGFENFYINGELKKAWDNIPGVPVIVDNINLSIGTDLPTGQYSLVDGSPYYVNWGGYWKGAMDDIRFYNIALNASQISSIYNYEVNNVVEK